MAGKNLVIQQFLDQGMTPFQAWKEAEARGVHMGWGYALRLARERAKARKATNSMPADKPDPGRKE